MKIPIGTTLGMILTVKSIWDFHKEMKDAGLTGDAYNNGMIGKLTGYQPDTGVFVWETLAGTWGPVVIGGLVSKYIGGPKGLNVNAQLKSLPFIKL